MGRMTSHIIWKIKKKKTCSKQPTSYKPSRSLSWQSGMFFNSREASWSVNDENLCWLLLQIIWPNTDSPKIQGPDLSEISGPVSETSELQLHLLPRENFAHLLRRNLKAMLHQHFSANVEVHILMEAVVHRDHLGLEWAGWGYIYIYICIYQLHVSFFVTVFERNWLGVPCWIWKLKLLGRKKKKQGTLFPECPSTMCPKLQQ